VTPEAHLFLKAPRPGTVKTRLAADLGDEAATAIYRALATQVLEAVRACGWPCTVWYAPADAAAEMRAWLGPGPHLASQPDGDLGARMAHAAASAPRGRAIVLLGGDVPGLSAAALQRAAAALAEAPAVLGPSADGGYWLLGGRAPRPDLFSAMPWSTPGVLPATRARLAAAGVGWRELETRRDVDTLDDARAAGLVP
jgi:rSAM/selenodomain-associated transferase 1